MMVTLLALLGSAEAAPIQDDGAATLPLAAMVDDVDTHRLARTPRGGSGGSGGARPTPPSGGGAGKPPTGGPPSGGPPSGGPGKPSSGGAPPSGGPPSGGPPSGGPPSGGPPSGGPPSGGWGGPPPGAGNGPPPGAGNGPPPGAGNGPPPGAGHAPPPGGIYRPPGAGGAPVARPGGAPPRPGVVVRPGVKTVRPVVRPRGIPYHAVRPYHGVFVYGPRPVYHRTYVGTDVYVEPAHMPERKVDRDDTVAVGLRAGSLWGGYQGGSSYADLGAGFNVRWRPEEALGLELAMQSYGQHNEFSDRNHLVTQATAQLFAAPWTRVSPFLMLGVTYEGRNIDDDFSAAGGVANYQADTGRGGLHVGLGIEFAIGDRIGLDFETRYIGFLDRSPFDPASNGQFQTTGGLVYHF